MNSQPYSSTSNSMDTRYSAYRFYTETIEISPLSALAFFEAGGKGHNGKRMFWQNREKTFTFVGLGHAHVLSASDYYGRFEDIKQQWQSLCQQIVNEEPEVQPILFGGFSFDPLNDYESEWIHFPDAYFVVPSFQLTLKEDRAYVSIHLISTKQDTFGEFEALRKERDQLIHAAQVSELASYEKPLVIERQEIKKQQYMESIKKVTEVIKAEQAEKVVIARAMKLTFEQHLPSSSALYQVSKEQPESFLFGLEAEDQFFFGATPERLVKVEDQQALSTCLAGSIPRGKTVEQDTELGNELLNDPKNRSEHQYVVNMISQVFAEHCASMYIPKQPKLMKIRDIQHLYTPVEGKLTDGSTLFDLVKDLHPTPALGGEPKEEALSLIRQYETMNRGYYAAPVGWIDANGNGEFAVAIRSALLNEQDAFLFAGGGIVADSTPESEYAETWVKFRPMLRALGGQLSDES
ncbi:isochorismate synthase [Planococcus salinus]|uniref:isochorismate synthase n=1 Tax=Planococcus salinus TaxID=1848460 RepID=A0A3M8P4E3_9BACL|nr:isochorismate synthase [Planococcus salinus]RNF38271.1 isochorismate synthase [Planococcus salinus]